MNEYPSPDNRTIWEKLAYQYRIAPEFVRLALNAILLTILAAVIESQGFRNVTDPAVWGRALAEACVLSVATVIWALVSPGKAITRG